MVEIIPAILPQSLEEITSKLEQVRAFAKTVQIDLVDGMYAPNTTWPFTTQEAWPKNSLIEGIALQFDLMLSKPQDHVVPCIELGGRELIIHAKSEGASAAVALLQQMRNDWPPVRVGVALSSTATTEDLKPFDGMFDFVQVMGIEHIGFQGHLFDARAVELVAAIRAAYPACSIEVDGGVALGNVLRLARAGADRLVAGSAIFSTANPQQAYAQLHTEANRE
jgi:ribulose-phosphate 3-epimerase